MPSWFRVPKGAYTRQTADWYAHQHARCSASINSTLTPPEYPAIALVNNSPAQYNLHVIGLSVAYASAGSVFGRFIVPPLALASSSSFRMSQSVPLYSTDPMPPGVVTVGKEPNPTFADAIDLENTAPGLAWYPPWEIAVITPNMALELYGDSVASSLTVMFDYIWMQD